jgi:beta-galactosidase
MKKRILILDFLFIIIVILGSAIYCNGQGRKVIKLNEDWKFTLVDKEIEYINLTETSWKDVKIPHTWNNEDIQLGNIVHYGTGWYKRDLIPESTPMTIGANKQYFLRFDGVGQYAEIYVNKKYVGEHLGSYSVFVFNITNFLDFDTTNSILVKVNNELNDSYPKDNFLFGIYGGIYRDVSLIITNDMHIGLSDYASSGVYVHQEDVSTKNASLKIVTNLINETSTKQVITIRNNFVS